MTLYGVELEWTRRQSKEIPFPLLVHHRDYLEDFSPCESWPLVDT